MPRAGLAGLLLLVATGIACAQDADVAAARASALAQLEAFRQGDFDRAYTYASVVIREQFGREAFERMVRLGYPQIAAPATVTMDGAERAPNGSVFLFLRVRGADRAVYLKRTGGRTKIPYGNSIDDAKRILKRDPASTRGTHENAARALRIRNRLDRNSNRRER